MNDDDVIVSDQTGLFTLGLFCKVERMVFHGQWRTVSDDQVVRLLEEIRETQKENAANTVALQNQQEAMAMSERGVQRSQAAFLGRGARVGK